MRFLSYFMLQTQYISCHTNLHFLQSTLCLCNFERCCLYSGKFMKNNHQLLQLPSILQSRHSLKSWCRPKWSKKKIDYWSVLLPPISDHADYETSCIRTLWPQLNEGVQGGNSAVCPFELEWQKHWAAYSVFSQNCTFESVTECLNLSIALWMLSYFYIWAASGWLYWNEKLALPRGL